MLVGFSDGDSASNEKKGVDTRLRARLDPGWVAMGRRLLRTRKLRRLRARLKEGKGWLENIVRLVGSNSRR